jgi:uncharacterized membrane protein
MAVVLALVAAVGYGLSDFIGGTVSRRSSPWRVAVASQVSSTLCTGAVALLQPGTPTVADLGWAAVGGLGAGLGVGFLFRGFSQGRMSVVAPLSAVGAALLPVAIGLLAGERLSFVVAVAVVLALPGIWLVAAGEGDRHQPAAAGAGARALLDGGLAGAGFGVLFTALAQLSDGSGFWPLTLVQAASTVVAAGMATALGQPWVPDRTAWRAAPSGPLSTVALVSFQLATGAGLLTVSAVLASLYPAATILMAMVVLGERIRRSQSLGLLLCGVTVALVALG